MKKTQTPRKTLSAGIARVLKRLHYPLDVMLLCVRWYVAYSLSLRNLEEMMAERGIEVDHSTVHRWVIKLVPLFEKTFRKHKQPVGKSWRMDETYIKVKGQWKYLYRAVDKAGKTIDFLFRAKRDKVAARRFFEKSIAQNGVPETITIDKSGSNLAALGRARPSGHQAHRSDDAGVQGFPLRARHSEWRRNNAHDQERADEMSGRDSAVSRTAVLLARFISIPPHINTA